MDIIYWLFVAMLCFISIAVHVMVQMYFEEHDAFNDDLDV
jgi:hypothetical protein